MAYTGSTNQLQRELFCNFLVSLHGIW